MSLETNKKLGKIKRLRWNKIKKYFITNFFFNKSDSERFEDVNKMSNLLFK
jgi:hypothetical protein